MTHLLIIAVLAPVSIATGPGKLVRDEEPEHLDPIYKVTKHAPKLASIVGGYDAGTMGLPGYSSPGKLLSSSPKKEPELPFNDMVELLNEIYRENYPQIIGEAADFNDDTEHQDFPESDVVELLTDEAHPGSRPPAGRKVRESVEDTDKKDVSVNVKDKVPKAAEEGSFLEGGEMEEVAVDGSGRKFQEGTVGTSYSVGSGSQGPNTPSGFNRPGLEFGVPGYPFGSNNFGFNPPLKLPGIKPVNNKPGFPFRVPGIPSQESQPEKGGTTVILESGPIFIKEGYQTNHRPIASTPLRFQSDRDNHRTSSGSDSRPGFDGSPNLDYVLSYG